MLKAGETLDTSLELHPFSGDLSLSSDKQYTPRLRCHEVIYGVCRVIGRWVGDRENQSHRSRRFTGAREFARIFLLRYDKSINSGISNFNWRHPLSFLLTSDISRHYQIPPLQYRQAGISFPGKILTDMWTVYFESQVSPVLWNIRFRENVDIELIRKPT